MPGVQKWPPAQGLESLRPLPGPEENFGIIQIALTECHAGRCRNTHYVDQIPRLV